MAWVRLDDGYPEHPKVDRVGPLAAWLNVCGWAYCARNLTDGFLPEERVPRLARVNGVKKLVAALVEANLWEAVPGGYQVHDYLSYNPSRETVLKERSATAKRVAEWREKRGHSAVSNGVTETVTNGVRTPPPVPGPSTSRKTRDVPPGVPPADLPTVRQPVPKPTPRPTLVGELIDKIKALDPELSVFGDQAFTGRKLKENPDTDLDLVAEAYVSFRHGEWQGSKMLRESGALAWVIGDLGGYVTWRKSRAHPQPAGDQSARKDMATKFAHLGATA